MVMLADGNLDDFASIGQLDANDWFVVGAGDYNGDQKDDLLVRQYSTGRSGNCMTAGGHAIRSRITIPAGTVT